MRISLLLQREPFGAILESTLSRFLRSWSGEPRTVKWALRRERVAVDESGQRWVCNAYLNAIFVPGADASVIEHVRREFGRATTAWRQPLQRAYVKMAVSPGFAGQLAQASVTISPPLPDASGILITGGNRRIRLIDTRRGLVYAILKTGVPRQHVDRELASRRAAEDAHVHVPAIEAADADAGWFCERFVVGTPINRLADATDMPRRYEEALQDIGRLVARTASDEGAADYARRVASQARCLLAENAQVPVSNRAKLYGTLDELLAVVAELVPRRSRIPTALTHGDLQAGNILADEDTAWIIDWEDADRRQAGYDWLVANLQSRFPSGLSVRLSHFVSTGIETLAFGASAVPEQLGWDDALVRRRDAAVFLIEEFAFRAAESANPTITRPDASLMALAAEASLALAGALRQPTRVSST